MKQAVSVLAPKPGQTFQERIEELAEFFDTTDTADLEGEEGFDFPIGTVEDMTEVVFRLPHHDLEILKRRAERSGSTIRRCFA